MKKMLIAGVVVALAAAVVTGAMAMGPGSGMGMGMGCDKGMMSNLTTEQSQKFVQLQKDTLQLRQKMLQLKTDLMTLRAQAAPDWKAIAEKQKEMVDVRTEMQKKAAEAGVSGFGPGHCDCSKGMGMGRMEM